MGKVQVMKKVRQLNRRTEAEAVDQVNEKLPQVAAQAILAMRGWSFKERFAFAWWLLWGRGEWKGV